MTDFKLPKFANEDEEAKWWYENRELISDEFQKAAKEGQLKTGGVRRLLAERGIPFPEVKPTPTTTIRLDPEDIAKARVQAAKRGLRYQTYLKMIIHEALRKAEAGQKTTAA
jgi:predicted DNA binding CopG/RHH family protein